MEREFDTVVVGGGLSGSVAALELARKGLSVALVAPVSANRDRRTTALMRPSVDFLDSLGAWQAAEASAAPLASMRIVDATRRLIRAPATTFHAAEIGETAFAYNVANADLLAAVTEVVGRTPGIEVFAAPAAAVETPDDTVAVTLADGTRICAPLAVAADGRGSKLREAAGIGARTWRYPQSALVTIFSHSIAHENISTEFHTEHGPFTQVPLTGDRSSLVWVLPPQEAELMADLEPEKLASRIEARMQSMLGAVSVEEPARCFELSGLMAHRFGAGRIVLVGESAHVFPPIGAQGLNLGLRDVMALSRIVERRPEAVNAASIAAAYDRARRADIMSRTAAVDILNRSLLSNFLPIAMLRSAGLAALSGLGPLRSFAMHEGMAPGQALTALGRRFEGRIQQARERFRGHTENTA